VQARAFLPVETVVSSGRVVLTSGPNARESWTAIRNPLNRLQGLMRGLQIYDSLPVLGRRPMDTNSTSVKTDVDAMPHKPNEAGTFHQQELTSQAKRKHFFSPLDSAHAEAVHRDAEDVVFTDEEDV
jgi:hypothetical protein